MTRPREVCVVVVVAVCDPPNVMNSTYMYAASFSGKVDQKARVRVGVVVLVLKHSFSTQHVGMSLAIRTGDSPLG
jgi:hypothetical protein